MCGLPRLFLQHTAVSVGILQLPNSFCAINYVHRRHHHHCAKKPSFLSSPNIVLHFPYCCLWSVWAIKAIKIRPCVSDVLGSNADLQSTGYYLSLIYRRSIFRPHVTCLVIKIHLWQHEIDICAGKRVKFFASHIHLSGMQHVECGSIFCCWNVYWATQNSMSACSSLIIKR